MDSPHTLGSAAAAPSAAAGRWARRGWPAFDVSPRQLLFVCAFLFTLLIVPPFVFLVRTSLVLERNFEVVGFTLSHYQRAFSGTSLNLIGTTLAFAIGSSIIAVVLGGLTAWMYARTNAVLRQAAFVAAFVSLSVPLTVKVIGWILLLGPQAGAVNVLLMNTFGLGQAPLNLFSFGGMMALQGILWSSVVFLLAIGPLSAMDPNLEEAAIMSGADMKTVLRRVTLPLARPTLLGILLLAFINALESFEVPLMVGQAGNVNVLSTQIYQSTRTGLVPEYGPAGAYAVTLVVIIALALIPYYRISSDTRRFATISGKGFRARILDLGRWRYPAGALMLLAPLFLVAPILMLAWASALRFYQPPSAAALGLFTADNYGAALAFPNVQAAIRTSVTAALVSATLVALLALLAAWAISRSQSRLGGFVDFLASIPLVFPGIVLGLAIMQLFIRSPLPMYGTVGILIFAFVVRYLPYGMRYAHPAILSIHPELEEGARVSGATTPTVLWRIILPLALPSIAALWLYVVLISVRELSMSVMLSGAQTPVISLAILDLWQNGQITVVSAFSIMLVLVLTALATVFLQLSRRYGFRG